MSRVKTSEYNNWIEECILSLQHQKFYERFRTVNPEPIEVIYIVSSNFFTKKNSIRIVDIGNYEKAISDMLKLVVRNSDDSQIFDLRMIKEHSPQKKYVEIFLKEISMIEISDRIKKIRSKCI